jgi:O-antigen/teichoic acid export membrane protein
MNISLKTLLRGLSWTTGAYALSQLVRLLTNVILTRLLAPEIFGIITIVNTVRTGIELFSDIGIGQNMVYFKNSDDPRFYNTVWSLQLVRGGILWLASFSIAIPIARFYDSPVLAFAIPVTTLSFLFGGGTSMGRYIAQRRMQFVRLNIFEVALDVISSAATLVLAILYPTIWALVFGGVVSNIARTFGSYFITPDIRHKFYISKEFAWKVFSFSKWIFASSIILFFSMNYDTLYLAKVAPIELLGVYGIARMLSGQVGAFVGRLNYIFVFPIIASAAEIPRTTLRKQLRWIRLIFLLGVATVLSFLASIGDILIHFLYDQRYQAAAWMFPVLIVGSWFSIVCSINEAIIVGLGKPSYGAIANTLKFGWLLIGLPLGFAMYGVFGAVIVIAISDFWRYMPVLVGQAKERFSFALQDLITTAALLGLIAFWELFRSLAGFGISQYYPIP